MYTIDEVEEQKVDQEYVEEDSLHKEQPRSSYDAKESDLYSDSSETLGLEASELTNSINSVIDQLLPLSSKSLEIKESILVKLASFPVTVPILWATGVSGNCIKEFGRLWHFLH